MAEEHLISLQPGTVIAGRYEVVKCLGAGSMGLVYACRHRELSGHLVAVKVLFPEVSQDKIAAARFRNEIFASYGVSHPNVVRAYEYIRDGDLVAYTMEYVGGGDLADRLGRSREPLPVGDTVRMLTQMCAGVQAIHDSGIVHRDLKPENILLTKEGDVKIADFGIARTGHGPKLTEHGGVVGTIDYVSPEYILNSQVDWRSDIYAIGILAYEMLTGESPFRGDSVYATMTKRLKTDPDPPSQHNPKCPPELDTIVLQAMQRDPEARYQSAQQMMNDLQALPVAKEIPVQAKQANAPKAPAEVQASAATRTSREAVSSQPTIHSSMALSRGADTADAGPRPSKVVPSGMGRSSLPQGPRNRPGGMRRTMEEQRPSAAAASRAKAPPDSGREAPYTQSESARRTTDVMHPLPVPANDATVSLSAADTQLLSTAIDAERMRKLHELIDRSQPWDLFDFLRLSIAILSGLCVGLIIVNYMSPDLFGGKLATDVMQVVGVGK